MTIITNKRPVRPYRWLSRLIAIIALLNLVLVFFDLSYIPWRDYYLEFVPRITQLYDPIKGIEPNRDTEKYLDRVKELETVLMQAGLESPSAESALAQLRNLSDRTIEDNPFALANKSGQLEKIKHEIRDRIGNDSAREAFAIFWSQPYLSQKGWQEELNFFNQQIRPLIETNYFRHLGTNGKYIDDFWWLDLPFGILFGLDFIVRTIYIMRTNPHLNFVGSMLRHWYDIFLLLPFFRWMRSLPVLIRLHQAELVNLDPIVQQINHDLVANFAEEMTEVVGVRMIDQMQESIQRGDVSRWLLNTGNNRKYIDINNINELQAIATRIIMLGVYDVIPQIQPEIQALLQHIIGKTLDRSPVYQQLHNVPGFNNLGNQLTDNLAKDLSQTAYKTLTSTMEDPVVAQLAERLARRFQSAFEVELKKNHHQQEIASLLVDMLEEIKINYIKGIAEGGLEKSLSESEKLRQIVERSKVSDRTTSW